MNVSGWGVNVIIEHGGWVTIWDSRGTWVWCFPPKRIALLSIYWSPACPHESSEKWRWTAGVDGLEFV